MPLIRRDVKRCPYFHRWNLSDQLEVCPSAGKRPFLQTTNDSGNKFQKVNFAQCKSAGSYQSYPMSPFQSTATIEYP